eukprot:scaffold422521_cov114-Attheya_sp.AAC.1
MLGCGADWYKRWFSGAPYALVAGAGNEQQVERRAWLPMVMISGAVLNKEEEERLESGCWVDN